MANWNEVAARADFARQARTIRRLFTAYFLAKAKLKASPCHGCYRKQLLTAVVAADHERARIVAAMRDLDLISEYGAVPSLLADAIERGEL